MTRSPVNQLPDFEDKSKMLDIMQNRLLSDDHGFYYYKPDWSDLKIAQAVNPLFKAHHAASIRRKKFGKLALYTPEPTPPPPSRTDILEARLLRVIDHLAGNSPRTAQYRRYLLDGHSTTAHLDDI